MADLLTHVLVPFVLLTPASWRFDRLSKRWIVLVMAGAAIPDLVKIDNVLDEGLIQTALGVPFSYDPISTLGGVLIIAGAITLCFGTERRRVYAVLVFGGLTSLVLDGLRVFVDGQANFWLSLRLVATADAEPLCHLGPGRSRRCTGGQYSRLPAGSLPERVDVMWITVGTGRFDFCRI